MAWFFVGAGVFAICGAYFQWGFFMNHHKARMMMRLFGPVGMRAFYFLLGGALATVGTLMLAGVIPEG